MAFPFGGHPTFGLYLRWAHDEHGFEVKTGVAPDANGQSHTVTRIFKDKGPSLIVVGKKQDDRLVPTEVGYFDRRLGFLSPWFSIDSDLPEN